MQSPKHYVTSGFVLASRAAGFTLIEVIIVLALLGTAGALTVAMGVDSIGQASAASERDLLVSLLVRSRTSAVANINAVSHGLHIGSDSFVLFEGDSYAETDPSNRSIPRNEKISSTGLTEVIFQQLSGDVLSEGEIVLSDGGHTERVLINSFGRIEW